MKRAAFGVMALAGACACGPSQKPQDPAPAASIPPPSASAKAPTVLPAASSAAPAPSPATASGPKLRATASMPMEGNLVGDKLASSINAQIAPMGRCVPLIRRTDNVVGSLNLSIKIDAAGKVTPDLQSPANPEATKCILDGARGWSLPGIGAGRAMVLLAIEE